MNIFLLRHGQSEWQVETSLDKDSNLTKLGLLQTQHLNDYIRPIIDNQENKTQIIGVSPLKRSMQTIDSLNRDYVIYPEIIEAKFHVASFLPEFDKPRFYSKTLSKNPEYNNFKQHLKLTLETIIASNNYQNIFLYTHAGVIKTILRIIHDNDSVCYKINNCSITTISWYRARWHINGLNDVSFLPKDYIT